tara:strand:+ start:1068 stop:1931 length:864 start_codon:yes stop_codon:yes gene_type:complete
MSVNKRKFGFVALLGGPNVGKSTLINKMVGTKVSIVTPKVQTTRRLLVGIVTHGSSQIAFMDTPGIFRPKRQRDRKMVAAAWGGVDYADIISVVIDARVGVDSNSRMIIKHLEKSQRNGICVLNKIDIVKRPKLLQLTEELNKTNVFTEFFMVSAVEGDGVEDFSQFLIQKMPRGEWRFPEDQLSDINDRLFAAEITREKLFINLHQELPYAITVETETWEVFRDGSLKIEQVVYVDKNNYRGILLGKKGERIKRVRKMAQQELQALLGQKIHLYLFVKVRKNVEEN